MRHKIILFLLFFLFLLFSPFYSLVFEMPKVFVFEGLTAVLAILAFTANTHVARNRLFFSLTVLVFLLSLLTYTLFPTQFGLFGNTIRYQGTFFVWMLLAFALVSSQIHLEVKNLPLIAWILWVISGLVLGGNDIGRMVGTLGEPNAYAAYGLFLFPFVMMHQPAKKLQFLVLSITFVLILFSGSRSGLIGLGLESIFLLLTHKTKLSIAFISMVCLFVVAGSIFLPFTNTTQTFENRSEIWGTAYQAGFIHPLLGSGFGNTEVALRQTAQRYSNNLRYEYVDSSHNLFLDWWVQGGILGLSLLIIIFGWSLYTLVQTRNSVLVASLLGLLTSLMFNPMSAVVLLSFWWLLGQGFHKSFDPTDVKTLP